MRESSWTEKQRDVLRSMWLTNTATIIGLRIGKSKSAVIGEAHRLDLPAKAMKRGKGIPRSRQDRTPDQAYQAPSVPRRHRARIRVAPVVLQPEPLAQLASLAQPLPAAPIALPPTVKVFGVVIPCCWPFGEPRTKGFRFCDADSEPSRQYCTEHRKLSKGKGTASERAADKPAKREPGGKLTAWGGQFA